MATHQVLAIHWFTPQTCSIRITKGSFRFLPGQYLLAGVSRGDLREYSLFSRPSDPWLEILVRVIPDGLVSPLLSDVSAGDEVIIDGPHGHFLVPEDYHNYEHCFIATGTGISPFHSIVGAYPDIEYSLYHGVRFDSECYAREAFATERYTACLSREEGEGRKGRVTTILAEENIEIGSMCYLCGSCDMIYDMFRILQKKGIPRSNIFAETYY